MPPAFCHLTFSFIRHYRIKNMPPERTAFLHNCFVYIRTVEQTPDRDYNIFRFLKKLSKFSATFSALMRLISERDKKHPFRKGESQWITVQVATAVSLMVMTKG